MLTKQTSYTLPHRLGFHLWLIGASGKRSGYPPVRARGPSFQPKPRPLPSKKAMSWVTMAPNSLLLTSFDIACGAGPLRPGGAGTNPEPAPPPQPMGISKEKEKAPHKQPATRGCDNSQGSNPISTLKPLWCGKVGTGK